MSAHGVLELDTLDRTHIDASQVRGPGELLHTSHTGAFSTAVFSKL